MYKIKCSRGYGIGQCNISNSTLWTVIVSLGDILKMNFHGLSMHLDNLFTLITKKNHILALVNVEISLHPHEIQLLSI